jgi:ribosome-associated protein
MRRRRAGLLWREQLGYHSKTPLPAATDAPQNMQHDESSAAFGADAPAPSKTRRKREMHELQDLGEALVALDPAKVAALGLPERLADAVGLARSITRHEARRRQMQYIGRLMRDIDPAPVAAAIAEIRHGSQLHKARDAVLERWRVRLLDDDAALADYVASHPHADAADLARLVNAARAERRGGGPPHHFRRLIRELRALEAETAASAGEAT